MKKVLSILLLFILGGQSVAFSFSSDEIIIKQGAAILQKNIEPVKGELYLNNTNLVFEPYGLNVQRGTITIHLNDIATMEKGWSKLLGFIPLVPNALKVTTKDGKTYRFTCYWPSRWKDAVEQQIKPQ